MKIGIDGHILGKGIGGVERVVHHLVRLVPDLMPEDDFVVFTKRGYTPPFPTRTNVTFVPVPFSDPLVQRSIILPWLARRHLLDLLHVQRIAPPWPGCPVIVHLHDILPLTHPEEHRGFRNTLIRCLTPATVRRAAHVLTVSHSARRDIIARFPAATSKITSISNGLDHALFRPAETPAQIGSIHGRLGLGSEPYVLYLGAITPRKNLEVVLRAFRLFLDQGAPDARLVIAGMLRTSDYSAQLTRLVEALGLQQSVVFAGFVADADCLALLQNARVFLAPSLGEGFDLPPLEAMACGVPVVASDIEVHRELIGEASLLFDPTNPAALATAMAQLWNEPNHRLKLQSAGAELSLQFSWETMAHELAALYRRIGPRSSRSPAERSQHALPPTLGRPQPN